MAEFPKRGELPRRDVTISALNRSNTARADGNERGFVSSNRVGKYILDLGKEISGHYLFSCFSHAVYVI